MSKREEYKMAIAELSALQEQRNLITPALQAKLDRLRPHFAKKKNLTPEKAKDIIHSFSTDIQIHLQQQPLDGAKVRNILEQASAFYQNLKQRLDSFTFKGRERSELASAHMSALFHLFEHCLAIADQTTLAKISDLLREQVDVYQKIVGPGVSPVSLPPGVSKEHFNRVLSWYNQHMGPHNGQVQTLGSTSDPIQRALSSESSIIQEVGTERISTPPKHGYGQEDEKRVQALKGALKIYLKTTQNRDFAYRDPARQETRSQAAIIIDAAKALQDALEDPPPADLAAGALHDHESFKQRIKESITEMTNLLRRSNPPLSKKMQDETQRAFAALINLQNSINRVCGQPHSPATCLGPTRLTQQSQSSKEPEQLNFLYTIHAMLTHGIPVADEMIEHARSMNFGTLRSIKPNSERLKLQDLIDKIFLERILQDNPTYAARPSTSTSTSTSTYDHLSNVGRLPQQAPTLGTNTTYHHLQHHGESPVGARNSNNTQKRGPLPAPPSAPGT